MQQSLARKPTKPGPAPGFFLLLASVLAAGCDAPGAPTSEAQAGNRPSRPATLSVAGTLENQDIDEASGIAASRRSAGVLWLHNDSGDKARLHAVDETGNKLGRIKLDDADNDDWEDAAAFVLDRQPYLLVADIGDNERQRDTVMLYAVAEPDLALDDKLSLEPAWRVEFRYPQGPRDAEAVAVDEAGERVLVLSKRDLPPRLYSVPLRPGSDEVLTAELLGELTTLPAPPQQDVQLARFSKDWHWQPTAMDIAPNGRELVIMTYSNIYYYERSADEDWTDALQRPPLAFSLRNLRNAEAVAFSRDGRSLFVTVEDRHAPLLRIDLAGPVPPVSIMTFNVQNLFDTEDAPGKDDKAFLPLAAKQAPAHIAACNEIEVDGWREECLSLDWNEATLQRKLQALADAVRQVDGGPDVIAFQEVENAAVLERLRTEYLAELGYRPALLLEGNDLRGIDSGFLTRLPVVGEPQIHAIEFEDFPARQADTRGVLQATFELPDGSLLTGFAVHFPAPFHPTAMRELAYRHLDELRQGLPETHNVFAAGDFNTTSTEIAATGILDALVRPGWQIAHETGCPACKGTYYYARDDNWSYLDMILYAPSGSKNTTWALRANSARVANRAAGQQTADGTPARFNPADGSGVSDHWPLLVFIEPAKKQ